LTRAYGRVDTYFTLADYQSLAQATGFHLTYQEDITRNTLPTYPVVSQLFERAGNPEVSRATATVGLISKLGLLRYQIFSFVVQK
jgi:hypothetical protein